MATRKSARPSRRTSRMSEADARREYEWYMSLPAEITPEQVKSLESGFAERSGDFRRAALWSLSRSMKELCEGGEKSRENARAVADVSFGIEEYASALRGFADMMEKAALRLRVSLWVVPDAEKIIADARAARATEETAARSPL